MVTSLPPPFLRLSARTHDSQYSSSTGTWSALRSPPPTLQTPPQPRRPRCLRLKSRCIASSRVPGARRTSLATLHLRSHAHPHQARAQSFGRASRLFIAQAGQTAASRLSPRLVAHMLLPTPSARLLYAYLAPGERLACNGCSACPGRFRWLRQSLMRCSAIAPTPPLSVARLRVPPIFFLMPSTFQLMYT